MLYIVLVLVLAALALLVTALITAGSLWAWVSIGLSVLAGLLLLADWLRRRNRAEPTTDDTPKADTPEDDAAPAVKDDSTKPDATEPDTSASETTASDTAEPADADATAADRTGNGPDAAEPADTVDTADTEQTALLPATGELRDPDADEATDPTPAPTSTGRTDGDSAPATAAGTTPSLRDTPPAEEATNADDTAVVAALDDEVVVVDEYPRYHLVDCPWLSGRDAIPIGVGEARQLGFTPCGRCGPDAVLAAAHRKD